MVMHWAFGSEFTACVFKSYLSPGSSGAVVSTVVNTAAIAACWGIDSVRKAIENLKDFVDKIAITENSSNLASNPAKDFARLVFGQGRDLSAVTYIQNVINKASNLSVAKAQSGFGYDSLAFLQPIWSRSRDLSYSILVLAIIVMSFMIMFRTKISPQAVITIQSAIPKIIITTILVTFSYAIAGLLLDLIYVVVAILSALFSSGSFDETLKVYKFISGNSFGLFGAMTFYLSLFPQLFMTGLTGINNVLTEGFRATSLFDLPLLILIVIVTIILIVAVIRAFFMLLKTLINVYLLVIFSPLYIVAGLITPTLGFGSWVRELASNLIVFPIVGFMLYLSVVFLGYSASVNTTIPGDIASIINYLFIKISGNPIVLPPTPSSWNAPFVGQIHPALLFSLISLSLFTLTPKVADIVKSFMSGRPFAYGSAFGEALTGTAVGVSSLAAFPWRVADAWNKRISPVATKIKRIIKKDSGS